MANATTTDPVVILPATDELNRGDQALVWQTQALAQRAGYRGAFHMLAGPETSSGQSEAHGIGALVPLLRHPSSRYSPKSNITYGAGLTLAWGAIALVDSVRSLGLLTRLGRRLLRPVLSAEERRTLDVIASSSACFVKGGGFLHSTASVADPYKAFFFLFHVFLAQSLGKRVYVMPNSFGPFEGRLYRKIVGAALRRCSIVTARESISQSALSGLGIEAPVFPDLAFGLPSATPATPSTIASLRAQAPGRPIVGLTARPYRFPGAADPKAAYERYVAEMAKFTTRLRDAGYEPVYIEHVISAGHHESDLTAIQDIASRPGALASPIVSLPDLTCSELKSVYGECDYVVGTRFHSVIFALSEGTPAMAIAYGGNKGLGIMRDAGLEEFTVAIEDFTADVAFAKFQRLAQDRDVADRLARLNDRISSEHEDLVALVEARQ